MPKPIRDTIGECPCPCCQRTSDVRADGTGKLYLMCLPREDYEGCGKITPNLPGGQEWVRKHMTRLDAPRPGVATFRRPPASVAPMPAPVPAIAPTPAPAPATPPEPTPAPVKAPARKSVFQQLWETPL